MISICSGSNSIVLNLKKDRKIYTRSDSTVLDQILLIFNDQILAFLKTDITNILDQFLLFFFFKLSFFSRKIAVLDKNIFEMRFYVFISDSTYFRSNSH